MAVTPSETLMLAGDVTSALRVAAEEARAPDVESRERYIDVLLTVGQVEIAMGFANKMVEESPASADAHYLVGRAVPSAEGAQRAYEKALKLDPLHARSHMGMGAVHTARDDMPAAEAAYARATRIEPSLGEAWLGLIRTFLAREDLAGALVAGDKAMKAAPASPDSYLTVAVLAPERAIDVLTLGSEKAGHDPRIHAALAEVLMKAGDGARALAAAEKALYTDPSEPVALRVRLFAQDMVHARMDVGAYKAFLAAYEKGSTDAFEALLKEHPTSVMVLLGRSQARHRANDLPGAIADLRLAQQQAPREPEVLGQLGVLLAMQDKLAESADLLAQASDIRPWDSGLARSAGVAASRAGRHDEAIKRLSTLAERRRFDNDVAIALADALLLAGKREEAYRVVLNAAENRTDERTIIALMAVSTQVGRYAEAADIMDQLAAATNDPKALALAKKLRAKANEQPK